MRPSFIVAPFFLAAVNAQQPTPTDAIGSAAQLVTLGNQAISIAVSAARTNTAYAPLVSQLTASVWPSLTAQIGSLTREAATNPQVSSSLAVVVSIIAPSITSLENQLASLTAAGGAGATSGLSSASSALSSAGSSLSSRLSSAASSASAAASSASSRASSASSSASAAASSASSQNVGANIQAGAMGAFGAAVLGLAAFL